VRRIRSWLLAGAVLAGTAGPPPAAASELKVVVTIKPLHALVTRVMQGAGTPELLVKGTASPHAFALKPSQMRLLNEADIFFRMSEAVEPFTAKVVRSLPAGVEVVTMQEAEGVKLLARRTGATFERHQHGEAVDGHAWLDPDNAVAMTARIARALSARAPALAPIFRANAAALARDIADLAADLERDLAGVAGRPYIVFHDAFQYLERRYGLAPVGSIHVSPDVPPSGKRLAELRRKLTSLGAICVFAEPQSDPRLLANLVEGTGARLGTLDAEGVGLEPGPDLYFTLMRRLAGELKGCLAPPA